MKILLDNCAPMPLRRHLPGHEVTHVVRLGWHDISNGELLAKAEPDFDLFITSDKSIRYQQNLTGRRIAILVLWTNDWASLLRHVAVIADTVNAMAPAEFVELVEPA